MDSPVKKFSHGSQIDDDDDRKVKIPVQVVGTLWLLQSRVRLDVSKAEGREVVVSYARDLMNVDVTTRKSRETIREYEHWWDIAEIFAERNVTATPEKILFTEGLVGVTWNLSRNSGAVEE